MAGALFLSTGLLLFVLNLGLTLRRVVRRGVTWWALAMAALFLTVTVVLGGALAGNLRWGWVGGSRLLALGVHIHMALAGWVLLVMVGVGQRLLPMFLLSHGADERPARAAVVLVSAGLLVLVAGHHGPPAVGVWTPAILVLSGVLAFLLQVLLFYRHRRRRRLDPGMGLAAGGTGVLGLGVLLALPVLAAGPGAGRLATAYGLCLVLGITVFIAGHYYKIVPFLAWLHRFGPLVGQRPVPGVADLYGRRTATVAGALLLGGTWVLLLSVALASPGGARAGALLFLAGAAVEAVQMGAVLRRRPGPDPSNEPSTSWS